MKIYGALLALLPVANAFVVQAPNARPSTAVKAMPGGNRQQAQTTQQTGIAPKTAGGQNPNRRLQDRLKTMEQSGPTGKNNRRTTNSGSAVTVQGGTLKTWSFMSPLVERVQVVLMTEGRPLDADVELWQGPDNTPTKMRIYVEDGSVRPFNAMIETPRGPNTIAIRNTAQMEFPLTAYVQADKDSASPLEIAESLDMDAPKTIQGGALRTYPFDPSVESVQVMLRTDGRPLNARIELLQGPNNNKQVIELYTEDGLDRPFFAVIETPGAGNVVRVVNTATVEFPMTAWVEPYMIGDYDETAAVIGGDDGAGFMLDRTW